MKKTIKFPAPQLSILKEAVIDLDMTARHYALIAASEGQNPEDVALSILDDLMEADAYSLTMTELRYAFMMVKINSLENNYTADIDCENLKKDGSVCGCHNKFQVRLSDADLNPTPSDYVPPKIKIVGLDGIEKEWSVIPPTMRAESHLFDFFLTQRNADQEKIANDKKTMVDYGFLRGLLHLTDENGNRFVKDTDNFEDLFAVMDKNKYMTVSRLYDACIEVAQYGVQDKVYEFKCKECGGKLTFRLPLLYKLAD